MKASVCVATFRRPGRLAALLEDLAQQRQSPLEVVVIDNDARGTARSTVERFAAGCARFPVHYEIQPVQNISLTRNRAVACACAEWLAFIDDDERAPPLWLERLLTAAHRHHADGVVGPVVPALPPGAPRWIRRGRFYDWPQMKSGSQVPPNRLRIGNALLRADLLRGLQQPFDPRFGLTGGEDGDLLARLVLRGARIVWSEESLVYEPVEPVRLSLGWLLLRAMRGGQDFARHTLEGRYGSLSRPALALFVLRAAAQLLAATLLAVLTLPAGRHRAASWLLKAAGNLGKLSALFGLHYREYARPPEIAS